MSGLEALWFSAADLGIVLLKVIQCFFSLVVAQRSHLLSQISILTHSSVRINAKVSSLRPVTLVFVVDFGIVELLG